MEHKSVNINQRIPLDTLHAALESYLNRTYSNEYIKEQLRLEFQGENRLKKSLRIVNKIIINNPIIEFIDQNKEVVQVALKKKTDRNIILIALLNTAFPFAFDVLQIFGKYFAVQDQISTDTIKKSISKIYGGNRATENGIYSVVPMFLEAGFFERIKTGVYQFKEQLSPSSKITDSIYHRSFMINSGIEEIQEYQKGDPYFTFIKN